MATSFLIPDEAGSLDITWEGGVSEDDSLVGNLFLVKHVLDLLINYPALEVQNMLLINSCSCSFLFKCDACSTSGCQTIKHRIQITGG